MNSLMTDNFSTIFKIVTAKWISKPLYIVTKLGVADILKSGNKSITELSKVTNTNENILYRLMRLLSSIGIFIEKNRGIFSITPLAECLQENNMKSIILMFESDWHNKSWDKLERSLYDGKVPFQKAHKISCFDWLNSNSEAKAIFQEANFVKSKRVAKYIIENYSFSKFGKIIDVGGGYGSLLIDILKKYKNLNGIVAEQKSVIQETRKIIEKNKLENRCKVKECNFFNSIPYGGDIYLLSNILHDWNDESCIKILKNISTTMKKDTKLLIIEMVVPDDNTFSVSKLMDIEVFVLGGGKERTKNEFNNIITNSGLKIQKIIEDNNNSIIECIKL